MRRRDRCPLAVTVILLSFLILSVRSEAGRDEPENVPDPATRRVPHVPWAKPSAAGPVRALVITAAGDAWDIYELAMRMDLDFELFTTHNEWTFAPTLDYYKEGIKLLPEKTRELDALLDADHDVIIITGFKPYALPAKLHFKLIKKIVDGTGCATFNANRWLMNPRRYGNRIQVLQNRDLLRTMPQSGLTILKRTVPGKPEFDQRAMMFHPPEYDVIPYQCEPVEEVRLGNGVIYNFVPGGSNYFGGPSLHPAMQQEPEEMFQAEYFFSLAAKIVHAAAGRLPGQRISAIGIEGKTVDPRKNARFDLAVQSKVAWTGRLEQTIRTHRNKVLRREEREITLKPGENHIQTPPAALPADRYFVDYRLLQDDKVVEWASGHFVVRAPDTSLGEIVPAKIAFKRTEPLAATVAVKNPPANATVTAQVRDAEHRILLRREAIPIAGGKATVSVPLGRTREVYHNIEVLLVADHTVLDRKSLRFYVPRGDVDDLLVYTDGGNRNLNGMRRYDVFRQYGINLIEIKGDPREAVAAGFDIGYRYWLTHCHQMTGGCVTSDGYRKGLQDTFARYARTYEPFGLKFFSTGDDSGVAGDFCRSYPNWVRPLICSMAEKYSSLRRPDGQIDTNKFYEQHELDRMGQFWRMSWRANLPMVKDMKLLPGDFELYKKAWRSTYGNVAALNRASATSFKNFDDITPDDLKKLQYRSPCVLGFQDWLEERYKTVQGLNKAWGSELKGFGEIKPKLIQDLRGEGKFAPHLDKVRYLEDLFIANMAAASSGAHSAIPDVGVGQGAANFPNVIPEVLRHLDTAVPYQSDVALELIRSMPHRFCGHTIGVYGGKAVNLAYREYQPWHVVFTGGNFIWFWSMCTGGLMGDLSMNPARSGVMLENIREMQGGAASLLLRGKRMHDGIAILHSRASGHASGVLKEMGSMASSELAFQTIIEDLGMQYRYVSTIQVEEGALETDEFKVVCLPYCQILTPKEMAALEAFVRRGGTVIADLRPGVMDETGRLLTESKMDKLFGIRRAGTAARPVQAELQTAEGRALAPNIKADGSVQPAGAHVAAQIGQAPALLLYEVGEGRTVLLNHTITSYATLLNRNQEPDLRRLYRRLFAAAGAGRPYAVKVGKHEVPGAEIAIFKNGPLEFLTLEKHSYEYEKYPIPATIDLGRAVHVYDVRAGRYLGNTDNIEVKLRGLGMYVFALVPYRVSALDVQSPAKVARGADALIEARLKTQGGAAGPHIVRFDVFRPGGERLWPQYKIETKNGTAGVTVPVALNDPTGPWRIVVTDVLSGTRREVAFQVK